MVSFGKCLASGRPKNFVGSQSPEVGLVLANRLFAAARPLQPLIRTAGPKWDTHGGRWASSSCMIPSTSYKVTPKSIKEDFRL